MGRGHIPLIAAWTNQIIQYLYPSFARMITCWSQILDPDGWNKPADVLMIYCLSVIVAALKPFYKLKLIMCTSSAPTPVIPAGLVCNVIAGMSVQFECHVL